MDLIKLIKHDELFLAALYHCLTLKAFDKSKSMISMNIIWWENFSSCDNSLNLALSNFPLKFSFRNINKCLFLFAITLILAIKNLGYFPNTAILWERRYFVQKLNGINATQYQNSTLFLDIQRDQTN